MKILREGKWRVACSTGRSVCGASAKLKPGEESEIWLYLCPRCYGHVAREDKAARRAVRQELRRQLRAYRKGRPVYRNPVAAGRAIGALRTAGVALWVQMVATARAARLMGLPKRTPPWRIT